MKVLRESQHPKAFLLHLARGLSVAVCLGAPVAEAGGKDEGLINSEELSLGGGKNVMLGLNKAVVINLPADAHDILVADPSIADALARTSRRIYMFGKKVGQNPPRNPQGSDAALPFGDIRRHGQNGLLAIQCLDLRFLIHA